VKVEREVERRRPGTGISYSYTTHHFIIEDWDFEEIHWRRWAMLAEQDPNLWGRVVERIMAQHEAYWSNAKSARVLQVATTGRTASITRDPLPPAWILRLQELPCLPDRRGFYLKPSELLLRTPETEPYMDVEPFLHVRLDRESVRPLFLLLGARTTPTGPDRVLECLRALAKAEKPPIHEVEKWYRSLDQMLDNCSTSDQSSIKSAFHDDKIVFTDNATWTTLRGVFLSADEEDVPGAGVIRASVRDLALWRKLGIAERPTIDLAIEWLSQLPSGASLAECDARRVRALLARHASRIWNDCGHWLNLAVEWVPVATLDYALTMQTLVPWSHLHEGVKQRTADLQRLSGEVAEAPPFSTLPRLGNLIEERFHRIPLMKNGSLRRDWLNQLGEELKRIELDDQDETGQIRVRAALLAETTWQITPMLEIVPYINGVPAGTPRRADAIWLDKVLYIEDRPIAKLARAVSRELGRVFKRPEILEAFKFCFDRTPEFVTQYLEENFKLIPRKNLPNREDGTSTSSGIAVSPIDLSQPPSDVVGSDNGGSGGFDGCASPDQVEGEGEILELTGGGDHGGSDDAPPRKAPHPPKPRQLSIIERFACAHGFRKDGDDRFLRADGNWMSRPHGERFWERRTSTGELVRNYWPKDHCLQLEPLQLDADVWWQIEQSPAVYSLILSNEIGEAIEIPGKRLCAMREAGELTFYPATYRVVYGASH
jgi:hypothetical protein